jgi:hypothetical protein
MEENTSLRYICREPSPAETIAGVEQAIDLGVVLRPLLNLVEIAVVSHEWIVGLFGDGVVGVGRLSRDVDLCADGKSRRRGNGRSWT